MSIISIEIKARCPDLEIIREKLRRMDARFVGVDHQRDTYFDVPNGRLKLRQGTIENHLIHYHRPDQPGPKASEVSLYRPDDSDDLLSVLQNALPLKTVVPKIREIYFVDNVKIHLDQVPTLGQFVEIEAIDHDGNRTRDELRIQCNRFIAAFGVKDEHLIDRSYSDMLLEGPS